MSSQRLTVHLLNGIAKPEDAIAPEKTQCSRVSVDDELGVPGKFFYTSRPPVPPKWVSFVKAIVPGIPNSLFSSSSSGLLVLEVDNNFYAFTFGYGRSLLDLSKIERQFGLKVALNRIDPTQLRSMDTKTFEDMVLTKTTQASKSTELPTFGIDISRDILRAVTGRPKDTALAKTLHGSNALVLNTSQAATDLPQLCKELYAAYREDTYKADFEWIDHLSQVTDGNTVRVLDEQLVDQLQLGDTSSTHMAMPEPIDWEDVDSFSIAGTRGVSYEDLDLDDYLDHLGSKRSELTIDLVRQRRVSVRYSRSGEAESRWSLYQCLVSEQRFKTRLFVLIEGRWFSVSDSLAGEVDAYTNSLPGANTVLIPYVQGEIERSYNERLVASDEDRLLLLDAKIKRPGGASSGIELCDILTAEGEFIHVKRKSRSATLSHLFAQGVVGTTTFLGDGSFRDKIRQCIEEDVAEPARQKWLDLVPSSVDSPKRANYTVSYVVIANSRQNGNDWLPFFSKLNLMQQGKQLQNLGLSVTLSRVAVTPGKN
ncbi:sporadically distributed protein [Mycobacteroides abscessus subsp. abscessus]|uniref:DUF6119 family protein n=1 Tax=Mycobacteroides abscessus TaxID=36809 RepID=UPI00092A4457|nr:DUF6119 family protein [Mycobacteroides abscessus]SHR12353.1 sporadically distributed protein [Mycobacteroides abscessus subsp. abscessus]